MKKFIMKMSIFLGVIALPVILLSLCYRRTNWYKLSNELYNLREIPKNISIVNVGNSREMHGLRYDKCYKGVAHNLASSSQPLYYDLQVLKHAKDKLQSRAVVIIPLSYFDWDYNWREIFIADDAAYNKRYYGVINPLHIYNLNIEELVKYGVLPALTAKDNLKYIMNDIPYVKSYTSSVVQDIKIQAERTNYAWTTGVSALDANLKYVEKGNQEDFYKLIDYCKDQGYKPVVICSPITRTFTEVYSKERLDRFEKITKETLKKYPDILFLDYADDDYFATKNEYYIDAVHMNDVGADAFTKALLERLAQEGYINRDSIK